MVSHGQTVHFRPYSVLHIRKAEHLKIPNFRLKVNFRHPMKRQIFWDTSGQDPNLHLALCHKLILYLPNQTKISTNTEMIKLSRLRDLAARINHLEEANADLDEKAKGLSRDMNARSQEENQEVVISKC